MLTLKWGRDGVIFKTPFPEMEGWGFVFTKGSEIA
jgi:hypothetical protein